MIDEPKSYPRRILLAVTGLSPQVVTETIYALAQQGSGFVPTEVHLITTVEGKHRAELALLSREPGWFYRLCRDEGLGEIRFGPEMIHCVTTGDGQPLDDIRSPRDNEYLADFITEKVRELTSDEGSALHASIAGGRKTMGFYLGYALSLYGRPQDRLSHVLVSEPFESSWNFFYPTPYSCVIETREGALVDTRDATVTLAEIPFVSLRHGLPDNLLAGQASYSAAVDAARRAMAPPLLKMHLRQGRIVAGGQEVPLPRKLLAFYALFARRALEGLPAVQAPPKEVGDEAWAEWFMREYRAVVADDLADIQRTERALMNGMDGDYFSQCKAQLHKKLKSALGLAAGHYLVDDGGARPRRYSLLLSADAIRIEG